MKRVFLLGLVFCLLSFSISSAEVAEYKEASTYLSDIANLGNINPSSPDRQYFMISGSADIPVDPNVKPLPGNEFIKKDESSYQFDGRNVTASVDVFKKIAASAGEIILGKTLTAVLDIKQALDDGAFQGFPALSGLIDDYFGADSGQSPVPGDVIGPDSFDGADLTQCSGKIVSSNYVGWSCFSTPKTAECYSSTQLRTYVSDGGSACPYGYYWSIHTIQTTDEPQNYPPPGVPEVLPPADIPGLSDKFAEAVSVNPDVAGELDDLMENNPDLWGISSIDGPLSAPNNDISDYPPGRGITGQDVNQWAQGQSAISQQALVDTLQGLVDVNPGDAGLAAELAKAQADQAQQEAEDVKDSFEAIGTGDSFQSPYNPGDFAISDRFSSFLNNVQGSGLFSFSSGFFNSLPGGGSPVYTVQAGQYGIHTVDLSETLGTGLAVLKTVLLLLFGFLSIRVVILKR